MERAWARTERERLAASVLLLVGIGVEQMRGFVDAGGRVLGAVCVLLEGTPTPAAEPFPVFSLFAETRQIFDLVVREYAATLTAAETALAAFFDSVDPGRTATVVSYLPFPHRLLGGRPTWAQDADVTGRLEGKEEAAELLAGVLPTVPAEVVTAPLPTGWWEEACDRWGTPAVVLQAVGASGGGAGTYFCRGAGHAGNVLASLPGQRARAMPLLSGMPVNVMGMVIDEARVLVLPPSRQLIRVDKWDRPAWAGNVFGETWAGLEQGPISAEVRQLGRQLAARGFFGPFGVDFLRIDDTERLYHDLNPRMNGAVDCLALYFDEAAVPLTTRLLQRPAWSLEQIKAIESELLASVNRRPLARYFISRRTTSAAVIDRVRIGGLWRLNPSGPTLFPLAPAGALNDIENDTVLLSPILATGTRVEPGDLLVYGSLTCGLALATVLEANHGTEVHDRLADGILG